jgi:hypothetical protein
VAQETYNPPKSVEPREPRAWLPHWWARIGPLTEEGDGLLKPHIFKQKLMIEEFKVYIEPENLTIKLDLRGGTVMFNTKLMHHERPPHTVRRLIWFRQMEQEMFTIDHNSDAPWCNLYAIGWRGPAGDHGYSFGPSGKIVHRLPAKVSV